MDMNMDMKDIVAKLKNIGKGSDSRKGSSFTAFFEKNPKMKIIIPVLFIILAVAIAGVIIFTGFNTDSDLAVSSGTPNVSVDILPDTVNEKEGVTLAEGADPFSEDVIAKAKLVGILQNANGYRTAIVATEYATYTLQVGDYVNKSTWLVEKITDTSITFSLGDKSRTIEMK
ncbi:MAG: hypothetical protein RR552_01630 [Oscillospiraceae bacterium]